jgi:hypothetical protein
MLQPWRVLSDSAVLALAGVPGRPDPERRRRIRHALISAGLELEVVRGSVPRSSANIESRVVGTTWIATLLQAGHGSPMVVERGVARGGLVDISRR